MAMTIEHMERISPTAEPYARLKKLYTNQKGEPARETHRMILSSSSQNAPVCSKTPARENKSRAFRFLTAMETSAAINTAVVAMMIGFWYFLTNAVCFLLAINEITAPKTSSTAPENAPNKIYCRIYRHREVTFRIMIFFLVFADNSIKRLLQQPNRQFAQ